MPGKEHNMQTPKEQQAAERMAEAAPLLLAIAKATLPEADPELNDENIVILPMASLAHGRIIRARMRSIE